MAEVGVSPSDGAGRRPSHTDICRHTAIAVDVPVQKSVCELRAGRVCDGHGPATPVGVR
jgi:hypothetical protein